MGEVLEEDLSKNKKLTPELKSKIRKTFIKNLLIAIFIVIYMGLLGMAFYKMELNVLATDLKMLSLGFLVFSIIKFEQSYRKDNEGIFLIGIETLFLAIVTLLMTGLISEEESLFKNVIFAVALVGIVYYMLKTIIIALKIKKQHKKQISDVREII